MISVYTSLLLYFMHLVSERNDSIGRVLDSGPKGH